MIFESLAQNWAKNFLSIRLLQFLSNRIQLRGNPVSIHGKIPTTSVHKHAVIHVRKQETSVMITSNVKVVSTVKDKAIGWGQTILLLLFCLSLPLGFGGIIKYVENRNLQNVLMNTTCHLLNHTVIEHKCFSMGANTGYSYTCFDEHFQLLYSIANQTKITSISSYTDQRNQPQKKEVGVNSRQLPDQIVFTFRSASITCVTTMAETLPRFS